MLGMRAGVLILVMVLTISVGSCGRSKRNVSFVNPSMFVNSFSSSPNAKPDFEKEIKPIFQSRCMPCHFQGGKVYDKLPFDKPETITRLGTKLFTRIKDEKEQQKIREFLEQD
jgi:hypothetical protein